MIKPFPWQEALRFGLGVLKLAPTHFWQMTPRELAAAIEGVQGAKPKITPPTRERLTQLSTAFPDRGPTKKDENHVA